MNIEEILSNEALRQREFPVARQTVFLAHAGVAPLPARVVNAMNDLAARCSLDDQEAAAPPHLLSETRARAAQLLHATPAEIALVGPTSLALSYVAGGLKFRKTDNVLIYFDDYPSDVYPWLALAGKGVEVRLLNTKELGRIRTIDVTGQVDENTRLVALASAHFISGFRIELEAIGAYLRKRNILFCVDAIQTLGAFPTEVEQVDFLAADSHKWLLGPCAAGIMFVRREVQDRLAPIVQGWHNIRCPNYVAQEEMAFRPDARRYEAGTANLAGLAGLHAALGLLLEVGVERIGQELLRKRRWLVPALEAKGYTVLNGMTSPEHTSGITCFFRPGADMAELHQRLAAHRVATSLRTDRAGQRYIRLSPHFYNTDAELQTTLELV